MKNVILSILILIIISSAVNADFWTQITGLVTDETQATTEPVPIPELVSEKVECVFDSSTSNQACYSGAYKCSGITGCNIEVKETKDTILEWKSSCGGETKTIVDGASETAKFPCVPTAAAAEHAVPQQTTATEVKETVPVEPVLEQPTAAPAEEMKETVHCDFAYSKTEQKCHTSDGRFGCSGITSCEAAVTGKKGQVYAWKGTCPSGYAETTIDGINQNIWFNCEPMTKEEAASTIHKVPTASGGTPAVAPASAGEASQPVASNDYVREQIECIFWNSDVLKNPHTATPEKCYSADKRFGCTWSGEVTQNENGRYAYCIAEVNGIKREPLMWKSTCGSYAHTIIDGNNEAAQFKCVPSAEVNEEQIRGKGFKRAYWQCYDGTEEKLFASVDVGCKLSETWQKNAKNFCRGHCYADGSKCGVNSFSVMDECYMETEAKPVKYEIPAEVKPVEYEIPEKETQIEVPKEREEMPVLEREVPPSPPQLHPIQEPQPFMCKDSCPLDNKCYPFGYRKGKQFCSDDGAFKAQSEENAVCDNNFECTTNLCVDSKCMSSGFIKKMLDWFRAWFNFGEKKTEPEVQDCGTDSACMDAAFKVCNPAKISDSKGAISETRIVGLEGDKCVLKFTAGAESLTCRFRDYAQGTNNLGSSMQENCEGSLLYRLSSPLKPAPALQTLEQASTVEAKKSSTDANDLRYRFIARDSDGVKELTIIKSNFGESLIKATPECTKEFITEQKFEDSDLPFTARVEDCQNHRSEMKLELDKEIVERLPEHS